MSNLRQLHSDLVDLCQQASKLGRPVLENNVEQMVMQTLLQTIRPNEFMITLANTSSECQSYGCTNAIKYFLLLPSEVMGFRRLRTNYLRAYRNYKNALVTEIEDRFGRDALEYYKSLERYDIVYHPSSMTVNILTNCRNYGMELSEVLIKIYTLAFQAKLRRLLWQLENPREELLTSWELKMNPSSSIYDDDPWDEVDATTVQRDTFKSLLDNYY